MKMLSVIILLLANSLLADNWVQILKKDIGDLQSINCVDSNNCFALIQKGGIEGGGRLYKSTDQGKTWLLIYISPTIFEQEEPIVINVREGLTTHPDYYFIASDDNTLVQKSTDGGKTFKKIILDPDNHNPRNIAMYDTSIGLVINTNTIYLTMDGWKDFGRIPVINNQEIVSPFFLDSNTLAMAYLDDTLWNKGNGYAFVKYYLSENKFDTISYFEREINYYHDAIKSIHFVNDTLGFASGRRSDTIFDGRYDDVIYRTTNGGQNWELVHLKMEYPEKGLYNNIAFADEKNGIAVGFYGKIAMTNDGGETWVYEPTPNAMDNARKMLVCWAGRTPLIGTWDAGIFRYEGDFFKFPVDTTDVEESPDEKDISIFPNPVTDFLYLSKTNKSGKIEIFSALGIKVMERDYQYKVDISLLSPGVYFLRDGNQIVKFIKY